MPSKLGAHWTPLCGGSDFAETCRCLVGSETSPGAGGRGCLVGLAPAGRGAGVRSCASKPAAPPVSHWPRAATDRGHRVAETDAESTPQVGRSGAAAAAALGTNRGYGCAPPARAHFIAERRPQVTTDTLLSTQKKMSLTFFLLVDMWGLQFQYSSLLLALNE